jgi:hypothetical protein
MQPEECSGSAQQDLYGSPLATAASNAVQIADTS